MKGLASFVMRGLSQAVLVTTALALISLLFPLVGVLSAASVALVTLRQGARPGISVMLLSTLACGLFMTVVIGDPLSALGFLLLLWLPVWALGLFLRGSRSLDLTIQLATGFGVLAIVAQYLVLGDPAEFWQTQLKPLMEHLVQSGVLEQIHTSSLMEQLAAWMTGILAAGIFMQLVLSLLTARWWQSLLYNPGGFRDEFHQFRVHKLFGVVGLPLMAVILLPALEAPDIVRYLGALLLTLFFFLGLAVAHGTLGQLSSGRGWLIGLYLLLVILMPQTVMILATVGLLDVWMDFRARYGRHRPAG